MCVNLFGSAAISPTDFPNVPEGDIYILIDGEYVFSAQLCQACPPGQIGLTDPQRTWCNTGIGPSDSVMVQLHDPLSGGANIGLHRMDILVDFAGKKTTSEYYDQDQLADTFKKVNYVTNSLQCSTIIDLEVDLRQANVLTRPIRSYGF